MKFTVAAGQFHPRLGDLEYNRDKILYLADQAKSLHADLLVLPELCLSGYLLRDQVFASGLTRADAFLEPIREASRDISLAFGLVEKGSDQQYYNAAFYYESGELRHVHRKVYLPNYGMFEEKRFFAEGHRVQAFDTSLVRSGMLICNDMWHPSAPWLLQLDGADMIIVPTASPSRGVTHIGVSDNTRVWDTLLTHTAKTSSVFIVFANLVGYQEGINFWGGSRVCGPDGYSLVRAGMEHEQVVAATLDIGMLRRERIYSPERRDERILMTYHELRRILKQKYSTE